MDKNDHMRSLSAAFEKTRYDTLSIDVARYRHFLEATDMTDAQKDQFLKALWTMIVCFVDLGFTVEPLSDDCGQLKKNSSQLETAQKIEV